MRFRVTSSWEETFTYHVSGQIRDLFLDGRVCHFSESTQADSLILIMISEYNDCTCIYQTYGHFPCPLVASSITMWPVEERMLLLANATLYANP